MNRVPVQSDACRVNVEGVFMKDFSNSGIPNSHLAIAIPCSKQVLIVRTELHISNWSFLVKLEDRLLLVDVPEKDIFVERATYEDIWIMIAPRQLGVVGMFIELVNRLFRVLSLVEVKDVDHVVRRTCQN